MLNWIYIWKSLRNRSKDLQPKFLVSTQLAITCSKLTTETLEQGVKYVQS